MPRRQKWEFPGGIVVTRAHVRMWMQSVGHRVPERRWHYYIKWCDVPGKIAAELSRGTFESTIERHARDACINVRKARTPGTLARVRASWPVACNDA